MKQHIPGCSGKIKFSTEELAKKHGEYHGRHHGREMFTYRCEHCHCWHLSGRSPVKEERRRAAHREVEKFYRDRARRTP